MTVTVNPSNITFPDGSKLISAGGGTASLSSPFGTDGIPRRDFKFFNTDKLYNDALKIYLGQTPSSQYLNETAASGYKRYDTDRSGGAITLTDVLNFVKLFNSSAITTSLYQNMYDDALYPLILDNGATYTTYWVSMDNVARNQPGMRAFGTLYVDSIYMQKPGQARSSGGFLDPMQIYGCYAWVNFDGRTTVSIRASGNISSVVRNSSGVYTVNLTNALPDANFAVCVGGKQDSTYSDRLAQSWNISSSSFGLSLAAWNIGALDAQWLFASVFR